MGSARSARGLAELLQALRGTERRCRRAGGRDHKDIILVRNSHTAMPLEYIGENATKLVLWMLTARRALPYGNFSCLIKPREWSVPAEPEDLRGRASHPAGALWGVEVLRGPC